MSAKSLHHSSLGDLLFFPALFLRELAATPRKSGTSTEAFPAFPTPSLSRVLILFYHSISSLSSFPFFYLFLLSFFYAFSSLSPISFSLSSLSSFSLLHRSLLALARPKPHKLSASPVDLHPGSRAPR